MVATKSSTSSTKKPRVRYFSYQSDQATYIVSKIKTLLKNGYIGDDIAILSPLNSSLAIIENELLKNKIPNIVLENSSMNERYYKKNHICLSTIHKSKVLEWRCFFLIGMSDSIFPRIKDTHETIEEDRRLFYVAITRAQERLFIYYTAKQYEPYVTRFIQDIDKSLYIFEDFDSKYVSSLSNYEMKYEDRKRRNQFPEGRQITQFKNMFLTNEHLFQKIDLTENVISDFPYSIKSENLIKEYREFMVDIVIKYLSGENINYNAVWEKIKTVNVQKGCKRILHCTVKSDSVIDSHVSKNIIDFTNRVKDQSTLLPNIKEHNGIQYIITNMSIIDIQASPHDTIQFEWIFNVIQMYIADFYNTDIEYVFICNPLCGYYYSYNIKEWAKDYYLQCKYWIKENC